MQFLLVYHAHYSHSDLELMTYREIDGIWAKFVEQRKREKEQASNPNNK